MAGLAQPGAQPFCAAVLPDDGVVDRTAGGALPDHDCLALIGDPDGCDVGEAVASFLNGRLERGDGRLEDLFGVVLDPAVPRIVLLQRRPGLSQRPAIDE